MQLTIASQSLSFLISCLLGVALGALYDVFRISRIALPTPTAVIWVEDVLYFLICAVLTFMYMLTVAEGQVRFFILIGELIGASLYYFTVGRLVNAMSELNVNAVKRLLRSVSQLIFTPVIRLWRCISGKINIHSKKIHRNIQKYRLRTKFRLKRRRILLYNLFKATSCRNRKQ